MTPNIHARIPYRFLSESLDFLLDNGMGAEVTFKGPELDDLESSVLQQAASSLAAAGLGFRVHAPFFDLNPGAIEPLVRDVTLRRFDHTLMAAQQLGADLVIFHPGYDFWKYGGQDQLWIDRSLEFWSDFIATRAHLGIRMALENVYEASPSPLIRLLDQIDSPWLGHCFDAGHWRLFSQTSIDHWFTAFGHHLIHLHIHDNFGQRDDHLPVGEGSIDFRGLFSELVRLPSVPSLTLESTGRTALLRSLRAVQSLLSA